MPPEPETPDPVVPSSVCLPEITFKAIVLAVVLSITLAGANAYLGLFAGMTVSASIPAAVISMAILRLFRRANILENNIVQTAASAGEALAAGVIFTIPALMLIGYWTTFDYWQTTAIAAVGGLLGVVFTIPLRRALIEGARLRFPEGVATAEVLKIGSRQSPDSSAEVGHPVQGFRILLGAAAFAGFAKLCESGFRLWTEALEGAVYLGRATFYMGMNLSPALIAVGYIMGPNTAGVVFLGGLMGWFLLLPAYAAALTVPEGQSAMETAMAVWSEQIRFVGIGGMLVGGLWTIAELRGPVLASLRRLMEAYRATGGPMAGNSTSSLARTDRDASLPWILLLFAGSAISMFLLYRTVVAQTGVAMLMTAVMVLAAFLFSAVAAYMSGLVGSSSNPISGVTIATLMLASLLLVLVMGHGHPAGPAAALLIGAVVCCAAAMGGDNLQDLKTGHLVGATPWKQQIMQVIGVVTAAVVMAPVLSLLQAKYGIGDATAEHPNPLTAPQATLMANLVQGVFGKGLPWDMVGLGGVIAALTIWMDQVQKSRGASLRFPVLAVALGFYLPLKLSAAILAGGIIAWLVRRLTPSSQTSVGSGGLLCAAGLVTGEALMGIFLALPIAITSFWPSIGEDPLRLFDSPPLGAWPGVLMIAAAAVLLFRAGRGRGHLTLDQ